MEEDESQTKEAPKINVVITCTQEEKEPLQPSQRSLGWEALERAKAKKKQTKEQIKAERLFNLYCYPKSWHWKYGGWKQAALDILSCEFIGENGLKGHAGHKKVYPVDWGHLITDLVATHFAYDPPLSLFLFTPGYYRRIR